MVLKNKKKKQSCSSTNAAAVAVASSAAAAPSLATTSGSSSKPSSSSVIKYPPVSSTKSLPPLTGRLEDLSKAETTETSSSRKGKISRSSSSDTIEFEVNQECK